MVMSAESCCSVDWTARRRTTDGLAAGAPVDDGGFAVDDEEQAAIPRPTAKTTATPIARCLVRIPTSLCMD
jgi:hypothetical protein